MTNVALSLNYDTYCQIVVESTNKGNKVTAQAVSEPPGPVGVSSGVPELTRRSFYDWTNNEKRVGPGVPGSRGRSVNETGDQSYEDKHVRSWRRQ